MTSDRRPPAISVTRTVVVRVDQELDETGLGHMRRILHDLIEDQGVRDIIVDLSDVVSTNMAVAAILADAQASIAEAGGVLELRVPVDPSAELVELAEEIPTFRPLEANTAEM